MRYATCYRLYGQISRTFKLKYKMKYQLLEDTGHSYSGISKIVFEEPEKTTELLLLIDDNYNELKRRQELLEKELESVKCERGTMVSDFIYIHQAMKLKEEPISFVTDGYFTEIKVLSKNEQRINYEKKKITHNAQS